MDTIRAAFDPESFRAQGHRVVDQLADYLGRALRGDAMAVLPPSDPTELIGQWTAHFPEQATGRFDDLLQRVLAQSNHLHHPRYVGHQVTSPLPLAALGDLVAALLNNGMAVYEMGPAATAMERRLVGWMAAQLGFPPTADGVFTSGGSAGNLTALLAARQAKAGFDVWSDGAHGGAPLAVLASEHAHYCVQRSAQIMGWGAGGVVPVETDAQFRMRPDALLDALERAGSAGRNVIAVVASACSTATGSFDPLDAIADFCAEHGLWLHVDGAHGASAILSDRYRYLLAGIARADSVVWDAHKMLLMPALITAVLFRDGRHSYEAFAQQASYLFAGSERAEEWFNVGARTLECTKRMMSLKLYAALATYGTRLFADYVTAMFDLGRRFAARLRAAADFELAVEPAANIVCFRYRGTEGVSDSLNSEIVADIQESGIAVPSTTMINGRLAIRAAIVNHRTQTGDIDALIAAVLKFGQKRN